jgi:spoIIIJ-associated protein
MRDDEREVTQEEIDVAESLLQRILSLLGMKGIIEIKRRSEGTILDIQGCNNPGRLIGESGSTLQAIQLLVTLIVCRKTHATTSVIVDVNGYRARRNSQLEDMAWRAFDRVERSGRSVTLRPMNASDRRIIHMTLSECEEVETESVDEDPETHTKRVRIFPVDVDDYDYDEEESHEEEFQDEGEY